MQIKDETKPYYASGGWKDGSDWHFFVPKGQVKISDCALQLDILLPLCNGKNTIKQILEQTRSQIPKNEILEIFSHLFEYYILVDAYEVYRQFYTFSRNKMPFVRFMTPESISQLTKDNSHIPDIQGRLHSAEFKRSDLHDLMADYSGTRQFNDMSVPAESIFSLLWSAYGKKKYSTGDHHENYTVISGGDLYPLFIYLILFRNCANLKAGLYRWSKEQTALEELVLEPEIRQSVNKSVLFGVTQEELVRSCGLFCIVADFARSSDKYSNKAYDLIQQEVGHVVANLSLCATQLDIGLFKCGGYDHEKLGQLLNIDFPRLAPLTTAVFGGI